MEAEAKRVAAKIQAAAAAAAQAKSDAEAEAMRAAIEMQADAEEKAAADAQRKLDAEAAAKRAAEEQATADAKAKADAEAETSRAAQLKAERTAEFARMRSKMHAAAEAREQGIELEEYAAAVSMQAVCRGGQQRLLNAQWRAYWAAEAAATSLQALRRGRIGRRRARLMAMYRGDKMKGSRKKTVGKGAKRDAMRSAAFQAFASAQQTEAEPAPAPAPAPVQAAAANNDWNYDEQAYQGEQQAWNYDDQQTDYSQGDAYQHSSYAHSNAQLHTPAAAQPRHTLIRPTATEIIPTWGGENEDDFANDELGGNWGASLGQGDLMAGDDDEFEQSGEETAAPVPIDYALTLISSAYVDQIRTMLEQGSLAPTARDHYQNTLLHHAAASDAGKRNKRVMCEMLIEAGADVNARNTHGRTVLGQCDPDIDRKLMAYLREMGGVL